MQDPDEKERLMKVVRDALKSAMKMKNQKVTERSIEIATKQFVSHLKNGHQF
jgi:hypothetical protein